MKHEPKGDYIRDFDLDKRSKPGVKSTYLFKKHENSLKFEQSLRENKLKQMYKQAAQRSLRLSQKYQSSLPNQLPKPTQTLSQTAKNAEMRENTHPNKSLYPSVTQIGQEGVKGTKNQRYLNEEDEHVNIASR